MKPAILSRLEFGDTPIVDFDGTMARLPIDWSQVRQELEVEHIGALWDEPHGHDGRGGRWPQLAAIERHAARIAPAVEATMLALRGVTAFAVLTNNTESAVEVFCDRRPDLRERLLLIVGRESLGGPKTEFARFRDGFTTCQAALATVSGDAHPVVYAGDQQYELDFACRLGARVIEVTS